MPEDQGEFWIAPPRVPPARYVKPADQDRAEAALGALLELVEARMMATPFAATADISAPIEFSYVLCGLVRCVALAASIRVLAQAREDEGIPIVNRSLVDTFLSTAYCRFGGFDAIEAVIRDGFLRENRLRGRYTDVEALDWKPAEIDPRLKTDPPNSKDEMKTWQLHERLSGFEDVKNDPEIRDTVDIAYLTFFRWDSTLSVHATVRSVSGHMFRATAGKSYPIDIPGTPPWTPLEHDVLVFTGFNGNLGDITSRLWFARRVLRHVASWIASVGDDAPVLLPALRALIDPAQGGVPLSGDQDPPLSADPA